MKAIIYHQTKAVPILKGKRFDYKNAPRKSYWEVFEDRGPEMDGPTVATFHVSVQDAIAFCMAKDWEFEIID